MARHLISSGTEWELAVGYSRAVRVGPHVHVAGTTATDEEGEVVGVGDPYRQTQQVLETISGAIQEAGAALDDVVRTRIFVVDIDHWDEIGRAHGDLFGNIRPAATMVEVNHLIEPELLVEIEATAIVESSTDQK